MQLRLNVQKSPKVTDEFRHSGPIVKLGRNPDGDLVLDHDAVSWDHAKIDLTPYQATVTDLGSTNGTFKNGQRITDSAPLWPGDAIKLGQSGPTLTIVELDLTSQGAVPPPVAASKPAKAAAVATAVSPAVKTGKPVPSETRGIAMQAVQELMAQQTVLKAQQEAHARHSRNFAITSAIVLLLLALLAGGLFYFRNEIGSRRQENGRAWAEDYRDRRNGREDGRQHEEARPRRRFHGRQVQQDRCRSRGAEKATGEDRQDAESNRAQCGQD